MDAIIGPIITAVAAAVAVASTSGAGILSESVKRGTALRTLDSKVEFRPTEDPIKDSRLSDARKVLQRQESIAKRNGWADGLLVFGQYVIGGVLASSFVQQSLSLHVIGVLGVLVLLSSVIRQSYRPDLQARDARNRIVSIRALIRRVEDDLYAIESKQVGAPTIYDIRQRVSAELAQVEVSELLESRRETTKAASA
jgi:hypothetical protein